MNNSRNRAAVQGQGRRRRLAWAERLCWLAAVALVLPQLAAVAARGGVSAAVNDGDWSPSRREAYARLLSQSGLPAPIGRLRLVAQDSTVPVFSGTDETALTLGAGHLPETEALAGTGNIAIAGHRDGFFRDLRHMASGDRLVLGDGRVERTFEVSDIRIVSPEDVSVLDQTPATTLTLITCHPFYYVGHAPERYVVRARLVGEAPPTARDPAGPTDVSTAR